MGRRGTGVEPRANSIRISFTIPGQGRQRHTLTLDDGTPLPPTPANLRQLGIRYRRPYNMRHTYATRMLEAQMTPDYCARQMGHSVEMFLTTYARWIDGQRDDIEMARLEADLSPAAPPGSTGGLVATHENGWGG